MVSEETNIRINEALQKFEKIFTEERYSFRVKSNGREFDLKVDGVNTIGVHVKSDNYKLLISPKLDEKKSFYSVHYDVLSGWRYTHFDTVEECILEALCLLK